MLAGRLDGNSIRVDGARAIAAVLKDAKLSTLTCVISHTIVPVVQAPMNAFAACRARRVDDSRFLSWDGLPIDELKGTKPTEKIDLSNKGLGPVSAIIIASCIKNNASLKELR